MHGHRRVHLPGRIHTVDFWTCTRAITQRRPPDFVLCCGRCFSSPAHADQRRAPRAHLSNRRTMETIPRRRHRSPHLRRTGQLPLLRHGLQSGYRMWAVCRLVGSRERRGCAHLSPCAPPLPCQRATVRAQRRSNRRRSRADGVGARPHKPLRLRRPGAAQTPAAGFAADLALLDPLPDGCDR